MEKLNEYISTIPRIVSERLDQQEQIKDYHNYLQAVKQDIENFKKNGIFKVSHISSNGDLKSYNVNKKSLRQSRRSKTTVLNENCQENISQIKLERISEIVTDFQESENVNPDFLKLNLKAEKPDMPPPQLPVKKSKKKSKNNSINNVRSTRSKASIKYGKVSEKDHDSDIILQKQSLEAITVIDSDDENKNETYVEEVCEERKANLDDEKSKMEEIPSRTTRTKKKNENDDKGKRSRSSSTDVERKTRSVHQTRQNKRKKFEGTPEKERSVYHDTESNLASLETAKSADEKSSTQKLNETYVTQKTNNEHAMTNTDLPNATVILEKHSINQTVVIQKSKLVNDDPSTPIYLKDIMTDDEDDTTVLALVKTTRNMKKATKAIFSPFEGSPVKKRVEAFEKLGAEIALEKPLQSVRSKTKGQAKNKGKEHEVKEASKLSVKDKKETRLTPQMPNRCLPAFSHSANKATKITNENLISTKSASALKASQQEFKERELRRREKEVEALRKRDALLQTQSEEKKKKREEKQIKAQLTREAYERNKQKMFEEAEKIKEEKYKQAIVEKQEKLRKQQEEAERKRLEAVKKAMEEKRKVAEEEARVQAEKERLKQEELKKTLIYKKKGKGYPLYLRQKAPLLPTEDCYDSDHEESENRQIRTRAWTTKERLTGSLRTMQYSNIAYNNFFILHTTTPDLREIFEYIDPKKLKRTSSAIWRAPPRFTAMPKTIEERESSEDE